MGLPYTVKQAIASQRFIPFWKFLQKDINSPKGALVLHWLTTVITISVIPNNADGYNFIVGLFTYGHLMVTSTSPPPRSHQS